LDSLYLKAVVLLLLLAAAPAIASAQVLEELDTSGENRPAKTQRNPNEEPEGTETSTDESSGAVDSAKSADSGPEARIEEELPLEWKFYWHEGLRFWLHEKAIISPGRHALDRLRPKPKLEGKIGGLLQVDAALFAGDDEFEGFSDGAQLRRFRLYTKGNFFLWVPVYFSFQFGITEDAFYLNDGYLQLRNIRWIQTFTLGFLKAPFSLERLASSRDTTFMERASPADAFAPGFKAGLKISGNESGDCSHRVLDFWFVKGVSQKAHFHTMLRAFEKDDEITDSQMKRFSLLFELWSASYPKRLKIEIRRESEDCDYQEKIAFSRFSARQVLVREPRNRPV